MIAWSDWSGTPSRQVLADLARLPLSSAHPDFTSGTLRLESEQEKASRLRASPRGTAKRAGGRVPLPGHALGTAIRLRIAVPTLLDLHSEPDCDAEVATSRGGQELGDGRAGRRAISVVLGDVPCAGDDDEVTVWGVGGLVLGPRQGSDQVMVAGQQQRRHRR
jgi:hypothetical protein